VDAGPDVTQGDALADVVTIPDASGDAVADTGIDAGPAVTRLFVTTQAGVAVWNDPGAIVADVAPTTTLTDSSVAGGKSRGAALLGKRLFVAGTGNPVMVAYDNADTVAGAAVPPVVLPSSAVTGTNNQFDSVYVDPGTNTLWPVSFLNGAQLFVNASTLTSSAFSRAQFTHSFQQTPGFAFDTTNKRLFLGQISGAGLLAWNNADTKVVITSTPDFTVAPTVGFWSIAIAQNRMYAANSSPPSIAVWNNAGAVTAPTAPAFSMTGAPSSLPASGFIPHVAVMNDVLVVSIQANQINLYSNASGLMGNSVPGATITTNLAQPKKSILSKSLRLYVLDSEGVAIFKNATTTPVFVAKVKMGLNNPRDIVLME
jgi:hypothetical protein